jgi:dihydrofolate reductase
MRPRFSVFIAMSLDGYIARPDGGIDWLELAGPLDESHGFEAFISSIDTHVIGRGTYDTVLGFGEEAWPYGTKRVIVLTHHPVPPRRQEAFFSGTPAQLLSELSEAKHVYVDGGQVISQFFAAGLIDDLVISVIPVVLGAGLRLFPGGELEHPLTLTSHRSWPSGMVQLRYTVLASSTQERPVTPM